MRTRWFVLFVCVWSAACASSAVSTTDLDAHLNPPAMAGARWGLIVTDLDGQVLVERRADERFLPASNVKLFTTAAGFRWLSELEAMGPTLATEVRLEDSASGRPPNLVLVGRGDHGLQDTVMCEERCLSRLAASVAASGVGVVGDVVGDDSWLPDERWRDGWSWEDLRFGYGAATSALVVNDNILELTVRPGRTPGELARADWRPGDDFYQLQNEAVTVAASEQTALRIEKLPGAPNLRLYGEIPLSAQPRRLRLGVDDPALAAAWRLKQELAFHSVRVEGVVRARRRPLALSDEPPPDDPDAITSPPLPYPPPSGGGRVLARLAAPDWNDTLTDINKVSQNLYAELLLRHLGRISGGGSGADGLERISTLLEEAGAPSNGFDLADGSGLSVYNRVSPRVITTLLVHAAEQPWGADWRATFPIGGVDGSLKGRFAGTTLEERIFAKTGSLKGVNALSGYLIADSGRTLAFSIIANDRPLSIRSATPYMDAALIEIAQQH